MKKMDKLDNKILRYYESYIFTFSIFGSFEKGDRIARLEAYKISDNENERVFRVHWKERQDGIQPKPSFADYEELKHRSPFKVIKWWESTWEMAKKMIKHNPEHLIESIDVD